MADGLVPEITKTPAPVTGAAFLSRPRNTFTKPIFAFLTAHIDSQTFDLRCAASGLEMNR
ncbi:MAG: hypothetical protein ACE5GA_09950 [Candidatus Zixiibacteriota bacterium]